MGTAAENVNCGIAHHDRIIKEKCGKIEELTKEFISLAHMKAQLETEGGENRCRRVDKVCTSFVSTVMAESNKMKAPQSVYVRRNKSRRLASSSRSSQIKKSPFQPSRWFNLRSRHAQEKSDQTQTLTPPLDVEDVRRHITYRLNQEESDMVERWRCHSFGTTEGDNIRFGDTSMEDSGLLAMNIQCLVYKGHRNLHKLWLNNNVRGNLFFIHISMVIMLWKATIMMKNFLTWGQISLIIFSELCTQVVHCYGEILMKWACCYPDKDYTDFLISPYAGVIALARLNNRDDLCWVKKLMKGHHNRFVELVWQLFFPCVINHHYILAVADCLKRKVVVYDSMNSGRHKKDVVKVGNWLRWICATVLCYEDSHSWDFIYPKDIPQQVNGHDCGVFVLTYMASIIMCGSIVPFSTEEICGIRDRVLVELSKGQLVGF